MCFFSRLWCVHLNQTWCFWRRCWRHVRVLCRSHCCGWVNACVTKPDLRHVLYFPVMRCDIMLNLDPIICATLVDPKVIRSKSKKSSKLYFRLVRFMRIWGGKQNILTCVSCVTFNLMAFTDLRGFISFGPFLCQWTPRAWEPALQDKVRILLRTKPATKPSNILKLTRSFTFTSQSNELRDWGAAASY